MLHSCVHRGGGRIHTDGAKSFFALGGSSRGMDYQCGVRDLRGGRNSSKQLYPTIDLQDLHLSISYRNESQRHNVCLHSLSVPRAEYSVAV